MFDQNFDVVVIGAGMAGLACAARLRARAVSNFCIIDEQRNVGDSWRQRFEHLRLNSPFHELPHDAGLRQQWGPLLHRTELVDYLESYVELHQLTPLMRFGERVASVAYAGGSWQVRTAAGRYQTRFLVVATAVNRVPRWPRIAGRNCFAGRSLHSSEYWNAEPFRDLRVLVIGSGNSGADIALDLIEGGAKSVALWIRAPRHVLSVEAYARAAGIARRMGVAFTSQDFADKHRYTKHHPNWHEQVAEQNRFFESFSIDLSDYGIRRPADGPATETHALGRIPWFDSGTAEEIRSGRIEVIDGNCQGLAAFTREGVRFTGGERSFHSVIFGTGFVPQLEDFLDGRDGLLHWDEMRCCLMPKTDGRCRSAVRPNVFFPGFDESLNSTLSLGLWGAEVADKIAEALEN